MDEQDFRAAAEVLARLDRLGAPELEILYKASADMDKGYAVDLTAAADVALLTVIARGERAGAADYQRWADSEPDPQVARLLRISGSEESVHADRVTQAIALLEPDS